MTEEIDITPQGMRTQEGIERVNTHVKLFEEATAVLANVATDFFREHRVTLLEVARGTAITEAERTGLRDSLVVIEAMIKVRRESQDELLRAVAGHPELQI